MSKVRALTIGGSYMRKRVLTRISHPAKKQFKKCTKQRITNITYPKKRRFHIFTFEFS